MKTINTLRKSIRLLIIFFITSLVISGATAFFIETGLSWLVAAMEGRKGMVADWLGTTYYAARAVNLQYPYMFYG